MPPVCELAATEATEAEAQSVGSPGRAGPGVISTSDVQGLTLKCPELT